jgi:GPI-Mannosyltransferase II co-activator
MKVFAASVFFLLLNTFVSANVEKTIFLAPSRQPVPDASIDNLFLVSLNPQHTTARTRLNATFPTNESPRGTDTWMLLEGLSPGSRYELRVCWLATQPTAFELFTHTMDETFETPSLLSSLTVFSNSRREGADKHLLRQLKERKFKSTLSAGTQYPSLLFLQISAAADYFTLNKTLMEHVPPVFVDVILDHYVLNVFPKSLVSTAGYIAVLAVGGWFLSNFLWRALNRIVRSDEQQVQESKKHL